MLTGRFDVVALEWAPKIAGESIPVFRALQEQLGLKLNPQRRAVDVIVIDRIQQPDAN